MFKHRVVLRSIKKSEYLTDLFSIGVWKDMQRNEEIPEELKVNVSRLLASRGSTIGFHLLWHIVELAMSTRLCLL